MCHKLPKTSVTHFTKLRQISLFFLALQILSPLEIKNDIKVLIIMYRLLNHNVLTSLHFMYI